MLHETDTSPWPGGFSAHVGVGRLLGHKDAADLAKLLIHLPEFYKRLLNILRKLERQATG